MASQVRGHTYINGTLMLKTGTLRLMVTGLEMRDGDDNVSLLSTMHCPLGPDFSCEPTDPTNPDIMMGSKGMDWIAVSSLIGETIRKGQGHQRFRGIAMSNFYS